MSENSELTISVHPTTASIPSATWNALASSGGEKPDNPFLDHAFFLALEESGCATGATGWQPQHILISRGAEPIGLMPLFLKSHSMGEYVFDHGWANAFERAGGRYYPKLQCAVPFSPVTGPRLLIDRAPDKAAAAKALIAALVQATRQFEVSSLHVTFCPEGEARRFAEAGFLTRVGEQFHWRNEGYGSFDDFLASLVSRKRKAIRRERREARDAGLEIRALSGNDIRPEHWSAFHRFYLSTVDRKWAHAYLNEAFFHLLGEKLGDKVVLMAAFDGREMVAGALNLRGTNALFGRNWGALRHYPFLHFELCYYQAIEYAIAHKLDWVEAGAQGEHKIQRGYLPRKTYSAHWITNPQFREAVAHYLEREIEMMDHEIEMLSSYSPFRRKED